MQKSQSMQDPRPFFTVKSGEKSKQKYLLTILILQHSPYIIYIY